MSDKLLLVREVAERLNVSGEKVRQLWAEGRLIGRKDDPLKATSPLRILEWSVDAFERIRDSLHEAA